ncbi:MFS transporter [Gordonia terrae]|uniref:MFS transporter n=1 Tax=Gordonia hongkongensis TaxID=1701090 RepID=UPI0022B505B7|nr:MFS transporter [Gordonia terrae]
MSQTTDSVAPAAGSDTAGSTIDRRTWIGLVVVVASQLMVILDGTIVTVALPRIRDDLGFSEVSQSWVMNAYVLAVGGLLLLGGRLGDLIGRRRALLYGIALFTTASLLGGLATSAWMLLIARVLQGVGAALAAPTALGLIVANFPPSPDRARAISWFSLGAASGGALGLLLGGVLTEQLSWHWVMLINVPIGVAILIAAPFTVDETPRQPGHLGLWDILLSAAGVAAVVFGFIRASEVSWADPVTIASLAVGASTLTAFAIRQRRTSHPLLPPRLVNSARRAAPFVVMLLLPGAMMGMFTFMTLHLQDVMGYSVVASGFAFLPFMVLIHRIDGHRDHRPPRRALRCGSGVDGGIVPGDRRARVVVVRRARLHLRRSDSGALDDHGRGNRPVRGAGERPDRGQLARSRCRRRLGPDAGVVAGRWRARTRHADDRVRPTPT